MGTASAMAWPELREELDLIPGPPLAQGESTWVLHDPVRQQFFRIDWLSFEILSRWSYGQADAIIAAIARDTPLEVSLEDIKQTLSFLTEQQLLRPDGPDAAAKMAERRHASHTGWWQWLVHHYLFFRLPLVKPDAWLARWVGWTTWWFSRGFLRLTGLVAVFSLIEVARQWDTFTTFLLDSLTLDGLASYGMALCGVKVLHELGHAFTLKRYGGRVPTMGVAFLVMTPMAYTDTNEAWRIADRWKRLHIASAGISTELTLGVWATLGWALLPEGALRSALFFLATTSWTMTVALNASPFMRFDGYYILCDLLDFPNLHPRSFALARWQLREWLFDLREPAPERFHRWKQRALIGFAWSIWVYRLVLFIGIAVMVYHLFTKLLGVVLFGIEIYWFIWYPVRTEFKAWWERRAAIMRRRRVWLTVLLLGTAGVLFTAPTPSQIWVTAQLKPGEVWAIHTPGPAYIEALPWRHGQTVHRGDTLVRFSAPEVDMQAQTSQARWQRLNWMAAAATVPIPDNKPLALSHVQSQAAQAEHARYLESQQAYHPQAPFEGTVYLNDPDLRVGQWVGQKEKIGTLVGPAPWRLETWLDEQQARRVHVGQHAHFLSPDHPRPLAARISSIDPDRSRALPDGLLAATKGGHVLVREVQGEWIPEHAVYKVTLTVETPAQGLSPHTVVRGPLAIDAAPSSAMADMARHALSVLIREFTP